MVSSLMDPLDICTEKQNFFVTAIKHVTSNIYMLTDTTFDAGYELYIVWILWDASCLKLSLMYVILNNVLQLAGIAVDWRCAL